MIYNTTIYIGEKRVIIDCTIYSTEYRITLNIPDKEYWIWTAKNLSVLDQTLLNLTEKAISRDFIITSEEHTSDILKFSNIEDAIVNVFSYLIKLENEDNKKYFK